jgi:L,D-transpeptidase ErfK/SrfK
MKLTIQRLVAALMLLATGDAFATAYQLPADSQSLVGNIQTTHAASDDNAAKIAQRYDIGYNALSNANPQVDFEKGFPTGAPFQIVTQHLLPNQPRKGIVINLPEMRMYYYPAGTNQVLTYPIGIGKIGKTIPITNTAITRKTIDPVWIPPQDIREFNLKKGIILPRIMPAGPDNPLGPYAIYMKVPTYLIHSTIFPESIGTRASFGCIRMYEADIKEFFPSVKGGIPVVIINSPVKVNWQNDRLYVEAYAPLEEHSAAFDASLPGIVNKIAHEADSRPVLIDWQMLHYISKERDGVPHEIGMVIPQS